LPKYNDFCHTLIEKGGKDSQEKCRIQPQKPGQVVFDHVQFEQSMANKEFILKRREQ